MPNINIAVRGRVTRAPADMIITDNSDFRLTFDFDAEWDDIRYKTVVILNADGEEIETVLMDGNTCEIKRLYGRIGLVRVGVTAGDIITTTPCDIRILPSILAFLGGRIPAPPDDIYSQIMALLGELKEGEISDEDIQKAVDNYLSEHPVTISPATTSALGGVIVGENLSVTEDGTLSAEVGEDDFTEISNLEIEKIISNIGGL